jgi:hypothetical protein
MKQQCFKVTVTLPDSDEISPAYANVIRELINRELNNPDDLPGEPWEVEVEPV